MFGHLARWWEVIPSPTPSHRLCWTCSPALIHSSTFRRNFLSWSRDTLIPAQIKCGGLTYKKRRQGEGAREKEGKRKERESGRISSVFTLLCKLLWLCCWFSWWISWHSKVTFALNEAPLGYSAIKFQHAWIVNCIIPWLVVRLPL